MPSLRKKPSKRQKAKPAGVLPTAGKTSNEAPKPAETPQPGRTGAWIDGEVNPDASDATLAAELMQDFRSDTPFLDGGPLELLARTLRSIADDAELCAAAQDGLDHGETVQRVVTRIESRARISIEIARRMVVEERAS